METENLPIKLSDYRELVPQGINASFYLNLLQDQILKTKKLTSEDFKLFLYACKRTGLDPITNQIYAVPRWNTEMGRTVMTVQTGIDGLRLVAQRTGAYAGSDDAVFDAETGEQPRKATVTVYKMVQGIRVSFTASARWDEYRQTTKTGSPMGMWAKMPYSQLAKCAESLALRKAFPNELSGIYSTEEMEQAENKLTGLLNPKSQEYKDSIATNLDVKATRSADGEGLNNTSVETTGTQITTPQNGNLTPSQMRDILLNKENV